MALGILEHRGLLDGEEHAGVVNGGDDGVLGGLLAVVQLLLLPTLEVTAKLLLLEYLVEAVEEPCLRPRAHPQYTIVVVAITIVLKLSQVRVRGRYL